MNYRKFAKTYSYSRISRYLKAAKGDKQKAQAMYYANARIARSFQPLLSFFEVVLRNQLHYAIAGHYGDVQWLIHQKAGFMSDSSLEYTDKKTGEPRINDYLRRSVERAETTLTDKGHNITAGRIIAELNLGFWNSLFETHHYALLRGVPCTIFNSLPTGLGRKGINNRIRKIRQLRNRVSHNEPICFEDREFSMAYAKSQYKTICDFLSWIDPEIITSLEKEDLNHVLSEIADAEAIMSK